jgi:hypothetical protein
LTWWLFEGKVEPYVWGASSPLKQNHNQPF